MFEDKLIQDLMDFKALNEREEKDRLFLLDAIRNNSNIYSRDNQMMHITSSAWVVNKDHDKVLLAFHNIFGCYSYLGGHNDGDPDCLGVAIKETMEETGLSDIKVISDKPAAIDVLKVSEHYRKGQIVKSHLHLNLTYLLMADDSAELKVCDGENTAINWFSLSNYEKIIVEPRMLMVYQKLCKKLKEGIWQY